MGSDRSLTNKINMDLRETPGGGQRQPTQQRIPNLGRRIFSSFFWMGLFSSMGYFLFTYTKDIGTEKNRKRIELEKLRGRGDQTPGKEQMMIDTLFGKGPASLSELREQTTQKRYKIAEENTVYAIPTEDKDKNESKANSEVNKESEKRTQIKSTISS